jgi:integrase
MGTITSRKRKDGTVGYTAQIRMMREGKAAHTESKTFDRKGIAQAWLKKRETELAAPDALDCPDDPPLSLVIERYIAESKRELGRTKLQVLGAIKADALAELHCSEIDSPAILAFARRLKCKPQTVASYLSHLGAVVAIARPAWGYPLDQQAMKDAFVVGKKMGITGKSASRDRRPTLGELDQIMHHFGQVRFKRPDSNPMQKIVAFALFSTRRLEEITRLRWEDLQPGRILVRDLKHPGQKIGNHVWCDLPPEAEAILRSMPRAGEFIFPYTGDAIGAAFTRACQFLGVIDLHLHDMRHHGVSRLFEMGNSIPHVAAVSGHRSWGSLKRYTHLRQAGDCMAGWKWLAAVTDPA